MKKAASEVLSNELKKHINLSSLVLNFRNNHWRNNMVQFLYDGIEKLFKLIELKLCLGENNIEEN